MSIQYKKHIKDKRIIASVTVCLLILGTVLFLLRVSPIPGIQETTINAQGETVQAPQEFKVQNSDKTYNYTSQSFKASYNFNAIAPHWKETGASHENRSIYIQTSEDNKKWSEWLEIEAMPPQRDDAPHSDEVFPESPIITSGKYFKYKVDLTKEGGDSPEVKDLKVTYINSEPSRASKVSAKVRSLFDTNKAQASTTLPNVIKRADWGSPDPDGNALKGTDLYWPPTYSPTKQMFVHHTVNSDYSSRSDGASVARAVYQYQTYTMGWGDVGYNYMVDQSGNIYEGRAHGENVTGGHTFEYNRGSMAVALLGCFEPSDSACRQLNPENKPPSGAMYESLTSVLAWTAAKHEIDPLGQQVFCKGDGSGCLNLNTISGHRDANMTSCPGSLAYNLLQSIRNTVAIKKSDGFSVAAKQINFPNITLGDNDTPVTLYFKNEGNATWYNSGSHPIRLATANGPDHESLFANGSWLSKSRPANLNEASVAPGQTGSFTFTLSNPPGYMGVRYEYLRLISEGNVDFGSYFTVPITTRRFSYDYVSQNAYTDRNKTTPVNLAALSPSQTAWLELKVRNTSNVSWTKGGAYPTVLGTDSPQNKSSSFCTNGWLSCSRPAGLTESVVQPGQVGTFEFPIDPSSLGDTREYFTPLIEGMTWMESVGISFATHINDNYAWSYVGQNSYTDSSKTVPADPSNLSPGEKIVFEVKIKNEGNTTWFPDGKFPLNLGTSNPNNRASAFSDATWQTNNRPAKIKEASVSPGQVATFEFTLTAPQKGGAYKEYFQPLVEYAKWLTDYGLNIQLNVHDNYQWNFSGQQAYTDNSRTTPVDLNNLTPGQRFYFEVKAKNTGSASWYKDGKYPLKLGTAQQKDRNSAFYDSTWSYSNRPADLLEGKVMPGQTGTFGGYFKAPSQSGNYKEYLQPVSENLVWLNDIGLHFTAHVN